MADIIKLLPDHVANQIAAGEVVQRPASVVKELLENAVDAGASSIKLIVKDGGKILIQVVDDGAGMSATDARLSFERHATSKIQSAEDLFNLHTKGFRGEALASIAAIAHVDLLTRPQNTEMGTSLKIEGSDIISQEVAVSPKGTSIAVKNLFYNIPARRNFLKSDNVELRHITDEFQRVALAHPSIAFQYYNNGSELFSLPKANYRQRIVRVFGSRTNEKLVPVQEDTQVVKLSGFVGKPEFAKKSRGEQFFFVNDRFIKSPYLHHAVLSAFEGLLKQGTHPGYFLYLEVDPGSIDINIHPTKTEVKFDDEHTLYAILRSAVKHSLGQFNVAPVLDFEQDQNLDTPYAYRNREGVLPKVTVDQAFNPFSNTEKKPSFRQNFQGQQIRGWENLYVGLESKVGKEADFGGVSFESDTISGNLFPNYGEHAETTTTTFQLKRKFIVTTIKSGMVIIDQSRAHQRVLYEKFLKNITVKGAISQQLLFPLKFSLSKADKIIFDEIRESLGTIGFAFGAINADHLEIKGLPLMIPASEAESVLDELISEHQQHPDEDNFSQTDKLSKTLSKCLSVKTGDILDVGSQLALVNDLFGCKEPKLSPFNKAIYITLTEEEIDNKFK
ncbi:DNA mismatch repair endonuclease MutL [Flavobacteriaceae bacterium F89]|uniref:DNA mismatch repair protein MutL n=1 Tax=Cerina litoralis TaxID=2874477 RepID=A0AAE3ESK7_9FLAO|nr:DNA mismatch repair endonuclease MutL [Cerina litoralis]MCG2459595.1 DNA mismatch repair endonuclease MutL [Cerina litoralis]